MILKTVGLDGGIEFRQVASVTIPQNGRIQYSAVLSPNSFQSELLALTGSYSTIQVLDAGWLLHTVKE